MSQIYNISIFNEIIHIKEFGSKILVQYYIAYFTFEIINQRNLKISECYKVTLITFNLIQITTSNLRLTSNKLIARRKVILLLVL